MINLLEETIEAIEGSGKKTEDVKWVGTEDKWCTWDDFKQIADFEYENGFGGQEISYELIICGSDWWMERHEYDGSEWWEFKQSPKMPSVNSPLTKEDVRVMDIYEILNGKY